MAVDPRYLRQRERKLQLREFHHHSRLLLTVTEQDELHGVLKEYQAGQQVEILVQRLCKLLDTPAKLDMMKDIRNFIPMNHLAVFDHLTPYHRMAHPLPLTRATSHMSLNRSFEKHEPSSHQRRDAPSLYNRQPHYGSLGRLAQLQDRREDEIRHRNVYGTTGRKNKKHGPASSPNNVWRKPANGIVEEPGYEIAPLQTITLTRDAEENLGFSIRGGSEHGLGIYISEVEQGTIADVVGLHVGDRIVEVNSISFDNIASSSAVKVLTGSSRLKMNVRRIGKIPVFKAARQKTSWFDTSLNYIVEGDFEEHGTYQNPVGLSFLDGVIERRIHLTTSKRHQHLGFNIRGGGEYGLGVYVSRVDPGGVAELKGLRAGDQVISVNGESLEGVTHEVAAHLLRAGPELILTVKDVGKYPAYKEVYAEYSWMDAGTGHTSSSRSAISVAKVDVEPRPSSSGLYRTTSFTEYPEESSVNSSIQTDADTDYDELDDGSNHGNTDDELDISEEVLDALNEGRDGASVHHPGKGASYEEQGGVEEQPPEQSHMLLPSNDDVVMLERLPEVDSGTTTKKKNKVPRSTIGVMALQVESMPADMKDIKLSEVAKREKIESLRKPGEINPRHVKNSDGSKKSRTFRERLFGTKARGSKMKDDDSSSPALTFNKKKKERKPLSNIVMLGSKSKNVSKSKSDDGIFTQGIGSQLMLKSSTQRQANVHVLEEQIKTVLNADEADAVFRYLQKYDAEELKVRDLMKPLEAILDTSEKKVLLQNIRDIIRPGDLAHFDKLKQHQEANMYEELPSCAVPDVSRGDGAVAVIVRPSTSTPNLSSTQSAYSEDSDIVAALPQKHVQPNTGHRNSIQEGFSGLRRQSRPSVPEVVLPTSPDEVFSYEIHGPKSTSKVYKARPSITGETAGREDLIRNIRSASITSDGLVPRVGTDVEEEPVIEGPRSSTPELISYVPENEVSKIDNSSTSDYYSGRSSEASHEQKEVEISPIYESVDSISSTPNRDRFRNGRSGDGYRDDEHHRSRTPDSQSLSLSALDFLDTLDDASSFNGMDSVRSLASSRASTPHFGSYDINPPVFHPPPPPEDSPPASCRATRVEDEGWQEWVQEDITMATTGTETSPTSSQRGSVSSSLYSRCDLNSSVNSRTLSLLSADSPSSYNVIRDKSFDGSPDENKLQTSHNSSNDKLPRDDDVTDFKVNSLRNGRLRSASKSRSRSKSSIEDFSRDFYVSDTLSRHRPVADVGVCEAEPVFVMEDSEKDDPPSASFSRVTLTSGTDATHRNVSIVSVSESDPPGEDNISGTFERLHYSMQPTESANMNGSPAINTNIPQSRNSYGSDDDGLLTRLIAQAGGEQNSSASTLPSRDDRLHSAPPHLVSYSQQHFNNASRSVPTNGHRYDDDDAVLTASFSSSDGADGHLSSYLVAASTMIVVLKKEKRALGMSISGGSDSRSQPHIKVKDIIPGGAAEEEGTLQPGMQIISVDGYELHDATHNEAVTVIRRSYMDKSNPFMELVILV